MPAPQPLPHRAGTTPRGAAPAVILLDIAAAFPSVSQDDLAQCLERTAFPAGMLRFLRATFQQPTTHVGRLGGGEEVAFPVRAGAPQGSLVSGTLLAIEAVPLVQVLSYVLVEPAVLFFADDAAVLLRDLEQPATVQHILDDFEAVFGLVLKAAKCVVTPLRLHVVSKSPTAPHPGAEYRHISVHPRAWSFIGQGKWLRPKRHLRRRRRDARYHHEV